MKFFGDFVTQDADNDHWVIVKTFHFRDRLGSIWTVPANTITDGASIPRFLWPVLGHPRETDIGQAAALHDFLYRVGSVTREEADDMLCQGMAALGASKVKRSNVWAGVRAGGWMPWMRYRKLQKRIDPDP